MFFCPGLRLCKKAIPGTLAFYRDSPKSGQPGYISFPFFSGKTMHFLLHPQLTDCRRLFLNNWEMSVTIGTHGHEKENPQRLIINVDLFVPFHASRTENDALSDVLDYEFIRKILNEVAGRGHFHLQETFCDTVARLLLQHPDVRAVRVSVEKPDTYANAQGIGVEVFHLKAADLA